MRASLLCRLFSSCGEWGPPSSSSARAAHGGGFSWCRARALGRAASVVVARGLSRRGSQAHSCGTRA